MHIITGMILSTLASRLMDKRKRSAGQAAFPKHVRPVHSMSGRTRFYCPAFREARVTDALVEQLLLVKGIVSAKPNNHTGSLLVHFDPAEVDQKLLLAAIQKLIGPDLPAKKQGTVMEEFQMGYESLNYALLEKTAGAVDVKTLLSGGLVALAVKEAIRTKALGMPAPITLLYWSFMLSGLGRPNGGSGGT